MTALILLWLTLIVPLAVGLPALILLWLTLIVPLAVGLPALRRHMENHR